MIIQLQINVEGENVRSKRFGNEKQTAYALEMAAKNDSMLADAIEMAAQKIAKARGSDISKIVLTEMVSSFFVRDSGRIPANDAYDYFCEKSGTTPNRNKFSAAMSDAGFRHVCNEGASNGRKFYLIAFA